MQIAQRTFWPGANGVAPGILKNNQSAQFLILFLCAKLPIDFSQKVMYNTSTIQKKRGLKNVKRDYDPKTGLADGRIQQ